MKRSLALTLVILLTGDTTASVQGSSGHAPGVTTLLLAIFAPFLASIVIFVFYSHLKDRSAYIGALSGLISLSGGFMLLGTKGKVQYPWIPSLGVDIEFYVDGLALLIAFLASSIGTLVFIYSRSYMEHEDRKRKYYTVLTAFMGSMIGLVFSSNMILLFFFWELTSICSFLLISHSQRTSPAIYASRKSLIITVGSGIFLLAGFVLLESVTGTLSITQLLSTQNPTQKLLEKGLYIPIVALIGLGAAAKSAQVPLHIWLPDAMEAPTPVSAFLHSATMVKAGIFLIARFRPILMNGQAWNTLFIALGLTTMTVTALLAVKSSELKELLAYSTASHLGLIVTGLGISGVLGAETATFHILNHAVFKASLFMVAGIILHETGTQKIEELSGLGKKWPILGIIATVSGLSMAGIPPLNGFYSKELLFEATYHLAVKTGGLAWVLPATAVFGSIFTFIYSIRFISVFYGKLNVKGHDISNLMMLPPAILALSAIMIGLFPNTFIEVLVNPALQTVSTDAHGMSVHLPTQLKPSFVMSLITIGTGTIVYRKKEKFLEIADKVTEVSYLRSNFYYHRILVSSDRLSDKLTEKIETGLLRTYVIWVLCIVSLTGISGYLLSGSVPKPGFMVSIPVSVVLATSVASVYAVARSKEYISSVLTLSILGFMISIFYLLMDAPDLVMTQLVVETMSLIIFLLVLNKLPEMKQHISFSRKIRDILISCFAGLTVFLSVLYSTAEKTPAKISNYYIEKAIPGSGGSNVVNVILVDFRGLDTMGEISVIVMAGLAVFMLFRMRGEKQ